MPSRRAAFVKRDLRLLRGGVVLLCRVARPSVCKGPQKTFSRIAAQAKEAMVSGWGLSWAWTEVLLVLLLLALPVAQRACWMAAVAVGG